MAPTRTRSLALALVPLVAAALVVVLVPQAGQAAPKPTLDQVKAQLDRLNAQGEVAQEKLNETGVEVAAGERSLAQAQAQVARSQAAADVARSRVGALAAAAYRSGGVDQTVQLLLSDDPTRFLDQMSTLDSATRHQSDLLRSAAVAEQRLSQDKLAADQVLAGLRRLHAEAAADYAAVQSAVQQKTALLNSLEAAQRAALAKAAAEAAARAKAQAAQAIAQARADAAAARARDAAARQRARNAARTNKRTATTHHAPVHRSPSPVPTSGGRIGQIVVAYAMAQLGDSYVWGAVGPNSYDCSGLTMKAYAKAGISLPHSSSAQYGSGRHIPASQLQPGDLVFYYSPIHHVGIYIGRGLIVNAENPSVGVAVTGLYSMPYVGAVRPY